MMGWNNPLIKQILLNLTAQSNPSLGTQAMPYPNSWWGQGWQPIYSDDKSGQPTGYASNNRILPYMLKFTDRGWDRKNRAIIRGPGAKNGYETVELANKTPQDTGYPSMMHQQYGPHAALALIDALTNHGRNWAG